MNIQGNKTAEGIVFTVTLTDEELIEKYIIPYAESLLVSPDKELMRSVLEEVREQLINGVVNVLQYDQENIEFAVEDVLEESKLLNKAAALAEFKRNHE